MDTKAVFVRALDEGHWTVYGPFSAVYAEPFRDALEQSGAFEEVEIQPVSEMCRVCGWRTEQGHDPAVHREWEEVIP
jgi:hypothetical protein